MLGLIGRFTRRVLVSAGTHGDGPYKSENVFHILYKPWSRISFMLQCSIKTTFFMKSLVILHLYRNISGLIYNLNKRQYVTSIDVNRMRYQALS